jgi:hypothetical protein
MDPEIEAIDALENEISPLDDGIIRIRRLISSLELCHHKAGRWVDIIMESIATGKVAKGPVGSKPPGQRHPVEDIWEDSCQILSKWIRGEPLPTTAHGEIEDLKIGEILGDPTPLKEWQVERVVEKIRSVLEPVSVYREIFNHEEHYASNREFREATMNIIIHDTIDGEEASISLAAAIDHLEPCHWNFIENLRIVLGAIGGNLDPIMPFGACHRNIKQAPIREEMIRLAEALEACSSGCGIVNMDGNMAINLGTLSPVRSWLAVSLAKTIRLQLG